MNNLVTDRRYNALVLKYNRLISNTLYLAEVINNKVPIPPADQGGQLFRCHNWKESHLALLRGLYLIDEFCLTVLPAVGLPCSALKFTLYSPEDTVSVRTMTDKHREQDSGMYHPTSLRC